MGWKNLASYWSVLGLATQASRYERRMNAELLEMTASAAEAASLRASSSELRAAAETAREEADAEESEASDLREEGSALLEASTEGAALAAAKEAEAESLEADIAAEEERIAARASAAALDGVATEEAAAEAAADTEEIGIAVCDFVPLLDAACDVVGAVATVGLEGAASSLEIEASAQTASAIAARTDEETETASVADLRIRAAEDAAAAAERKGEEAAAAEAAEDERLAGETKRSEAQGLAEEARADEESAGKETADAARREERAADLLEDAAVRGVDSCWDAIAAGLTGLVALGFFSFRIASKAVVASVRMTTSSTSSRSGVLGQSKARTTGSPFGRDAFCVARHVVVFGLTACAYRDAFRGFPRSSPRARGGSILRFATTGACAQTLLLHSVPSLLLSRDRSRTMAVAEGLRFAVSLSLLYVLEILILWLTCGKLLIRGLPFLAALDNSYPWIVFLVPYGLHLWCCLQEVPPADNTDRRVPQTADEKTRSGIATEADALLPTRALTESEPLENDDDAPPASSSAAIAWCSTLWRDILGLRIPFEILVFSCMLRVLTRCRSSIAPLWSSASKDALWAHRPDWLLPFAAILPVCAVSWVIVRASGRNKFGP